MIGKVSKAKGGFTLAEAIVATLIVAIVLVSVLGLMSQCTRYLTDVRRTARASQVLQQEMESIRLTNVWSGLTGLAGTSFVDPMDSNHIYYGTIAETNYATFGTTTTVETVTLTLTWTNQASRQVLTNRLTALIGYGGLNKYIY